MYPNTIKLTMASRHNKLIHIQSKTSVPDYEGGYFELWKTDNPCWASVEPLHEEQVFNYKKAGVEATHLVGIRGKISINELNRILYGTRVFEILTIKNVMEDGILTLATCKEVR